MSKHWRFGGSTAERTIECTAWRGLSDGMPNSPASQAAMDGTAMHYLFEQALIDDDYDPSDALGETIEGVVITEVMVDKVYTALESQDQITFDEQFEVVNAEMQAQIADDIGGTADVVAWNTKTNVFAVGDLKTGDGYMVYAENNNQLLFYAYMVLMNVKDLFEFNDETRFLLYIIQPSERREEPVDIWETDLKTVLKFGDNIIQAVRLAKSTQSRTASGKWCKYCPAEAVCPTKSGVVETGMRLDVQHITELNKALAIVEEIENWAKSVRKLAHEQAEQGVKLEGWKLVNKRATREWNDQPAIDKKLRLMRKLTIPDYMKMTVISPAQLEKVCKAKGVDFKQFNDYISQHSSGTTLAHASDKRPEALPVAALVNMANGVLN